MVSFGISVGEVTLPIPVHNPSSLEDPCARLVPVEGVKMF